MRSTAITRNVSTTPGLIDQCQALRKLQNVVEMRRGEVVPLWNRCRSIATDTGHIVPRRECGKAKYEPECVVRFCHPCHVRYDQKADDIAVPAHLVRECVVTIQSASKVRFPTFGKGRLVAIDEPVRFEECEE